MDLVHGFRLGGRRVSIVAFSDVGEGTIGVYAGVGVGYDFSDRFSLGLAYDYFGPGKDDVSLQTNTLSLTGEVRF